MWATYLQRFRRWYQGEETGSSSSPVEAVSEPNVFLFSEISPLSRVYALSLSCFIHSGPNSRGVLK